jgi:glycosyltransferase involved in cell wall biosynthesis
VNTAPLISVILPVYNGETYLREAIGSILEQTVRDFELIVGDDGSTDRSILIAEEFKDPRIRIIRNESNMGLIYTLNNLINCATGEFIARMDADDIANPTRFALQIEKFRKNPSAGIVCGFMAEITSPTKAVKHKFLNSESLKAALIFTNTIVHPTVMFKRAYITGKDIYSKEFPHGEDYAAWLTLYNEFDFEIVPEILILHRAHKEQVSVIHYEKQKESISRAHKMFFSSHGVQCNESEIELHLKLFLESYTYESGFIKDVQDWLEKLTQQNITRQFINPIIFSSITGEWWFRVNQSLASGGFSDYNFWKKSILSKTYNPPFTSLFRLILNSVKSVIINKMK